MYICIIRPREMTIGYGWMWDLEILGTLVLWTDGTEWNEKGVVGVVVAVV